MSYAVMPLTDYQGMCDKVREKIDAPPTNLLEGATFEEREIGEVFRDIFLCSTPFHLEDNAKYTINFPNATDLDNVIYIAGADWNLSNYTPPFIRDTEFPYSFIPIEQCNPVPELREYRIFILKPGDSNYIDTTGATLVKVDNTIKSGEMPSKIEEVYHAGQLNVLSNTECLQGNKSGSIVSIADISPIEHNVGVLVERPKEGVNLLENATFEIREIYEQYHDIFLCSTPFHLEDNVVYTLDFPNADDNSTNLVYIAAAEWDTTNYNTGSILVSELPVSFSPAELQEAYLNFIPESKEYRIFIYNNNSTNIEDYINTTGATLMGVGYAPSANEKVYVGGANLLNLDRTLGTLKSGQNGKRTDFEFDKYYEGITRTNVYVGSGYATATIENGVITVKTNKMYYGIGIPFKVKPNTSYVYSSRGGVTGSPYIRVSLYTEDGAFLKEVSPYSFVTPENCTVAMLSIVGQSDNSVVTVTNPQIEADTTIHEYEPYIEPTEYTTNAEGVIEGLKNRYPSMSFSTDSEGSTITVNYYKDIDKVFAELNTAIALTGGN